MLKIRDATYQDIPDIKDLFQQTILTINLKDYTPEQVKYWADKGEDPHVWKERIDKQHFIVAEHENKITGFAALNPDGYLNSLFVHKHYQGQGIASALLEHIEEYSVQHSISEIIADVSITAKSFFEKKNYIILQQQTVNICIDMINFKMKKIL